jgi:protein arginine N-methyltransferase 5
MIPESSFIPNRVGQPVLSKGHKAFITKFMRLRHTPWILLSDVGFIPSETAQSIDTSVNGHTPVETQSQTESFPLSPTPAEASQILRRQAKSLRDDPTPHLSYLRYLQRNQSPRSTIERFGVGYQDHLQAPLQPLTDDLESITYEVFEKDPVKYEWYERAIMHALLDWSAQGKSTSSNSGAVVVAVVGAGRGPLVTRALRASKSAQVPIELWAVEKNTNAYVLLQRHNQTHWNGQVTVVRSYMKAWQGPSQADGSHYHVDILVSELLGSFADNELSPECLDGVQHVLNPRHGISIPASYTAHLTPIATPKIHADLLGKSIVDKDSFEVPYVVMLHQFDYLSYFPESHDESPTNSAQTRDNGTPPPEPVPNVQECWSFTHPQSSAILTQSALRRAGGTTGGSGGLSGGDGWNEHNARFKQLTFPCASRGVCHGLAGYFETTLYSSQTADAPIIELSTNPVTMATKSADLISWFPIFFPLKTPLNFPDESELVVNMWRMTDDRKVWYEWLIETFAVIDHGKGRCRVRLGASELHSSKKNGCSM